MTGFRCRAVLRTLLPVAAVLFVGLPGAAQLPASTLRVPAPGPTDTVWWRAAEAPARWPAADPVVVAAVRWERVRAGLELGTLDLSVNRGMLPLRVVVIRAALTSFDVALEQRMAGGRAAWRVADAPADAVVAFNAGQFAEAGPWGWLVLDDRTLQSPGTGPLTAAVAFADTLAWIDAPGIETAARRRWRFAFQSYPVLLRDGRVPAALQRADAGVDVAHRDARLALGRAGDTLLVVLTRYRALGRVLERLPAGLTVPETAALLGALGARDAVMLDGGLSAQLMVRTAAGTVRAWPGSRRVPLALLLRPRTPPTGAPTPHR